MHDLQLNHYIQALRDESYGFITIYTSFAGPILLYLSVSNNW